MQTLIRRRDRASSRALTGRSRPLVPELCAACKNAPFDARCRNEHELDLARPASEGGAGH